MLTAKETIDTPTAKVVCDGDPESPHPRVYLTVGDQGFVDCPYCGRHFVLQAGAPADHGH